MYRATVVVLILTVAAAADLFAAQRTFVVVNKCSETLWPAGVLHQSGRDDCLTDETTRSDQLCQPVV